MIWCYYYFENEIANELKLEENSFYLFIQEAQLPQRDSASATHVFLGSLTDRTLHLPFRHRLAKLVSTLSANKLCDIRTSRLNQAFKVIEGHHSLLVPTGIQNGVLS